ncbi:XapX domain-containing protein [Halosegnis sp.]|uniref:XapX domain-containing protein n=1 Tax=Halosegnis sp. TaxID=2864959 RepID=UPI0035D476EA
MVNIEISILALLTGIVVGVLFAYVQVPIPAPATLPGVLGVAGIYLGFKLVEWAGVGVDLLGALGL